MLKTLYSLGGTLKSGRLLPHTRVGTPTLTGGNPYFSISRDVHVGEYNNGSFVGNKVSTLFVYIVETLR